MHLGFVHRNILGTHSKNGVSWTHFISTRRFRPNKWLAFTMTERTFCCHCMLLIWRLLIRISVSWWGMGIKRCFGWFFCPTSTQNTWSFKRTIDILRILVFHHWWKVVVRLVVGVLISFTFYILWRLNIISITIIEFRWSISERLDIWYTNLWITSRFISFTITKGFFFTSWRLPWIWIMVLNVWRHSTFVLWPTSIIHIMLFLR